MSESSSPPPSPQNDTGIRGRFEAALGRWGHFVARRAVWVLLAALAFAAALGTQIQHLRLETDSEGYYHEDDPLRVEYAGFRKQFGRETGVIVMFKPAGGVFEFGFLERLRAIHEAIEEEVPLIVEVNSLINARNTVGYEDRLEVGELFEDWPEDQAALDAIEARARANPLYRNFLLSEDGAVTALAVETEAYTSPHALDELAGFDDFDATEIGDDGEEELTPITGEQDLAIALAIQALIDQHADATDEVHMAGMPVFSVELARNMRTDMSLFTGLSVGLVALFLALLFRRVAGVVLPIVTVGLSVFSTLSFMGATRTPLMPPTQMIPSFMLAVGVGASVHLLAIFYQALRRGDAKPDAIAYALAHSGLPIIMTSLTTAGGLISFMPAALRPISHFGWVTPVGVLMALGYTLTLLPAAMALIPMKAAEARRDHTLSQRLLVAAGRFSTRNARTVVAAWALAIAIAVTGIVQLHLGHHMLEWFPEDAPIRQAMEFANDELGGPMAYEIVIDTGGAKGWQDPALLDRIHALHDALPGIEHREIKAAKTISLVDVVKETHRALNANDDAYYAIPDDRRLIAQELLLFENSGTDDVEELVDTQYAFGRLSVRVPMVDGAYYDAYLDQVDALVAESVGADVEVQMTGGLKLFGATIRAALSTLVSAYSTALVIITVLMVVLIGNLRMGLISMLPNLAPIMLALGILGWIGIPLDMFTMMTGSIAIGLAVDDTIHFMHNFRRYHAASGDVDDAVERTLASSGQALLFTSLVLITGFSVYTQAYMHHLLWFGITCSSAIALAFIADITLAPALVRLFVRDRPADAVV